MFAAKFLITDHASHDVDKFINQSSIIPVEIIYMSNGNFHKIRYLKNIFLFFKMIFFYKFCKNVANKSSTIFIFY